MAGKCSKGRIMYNYTVPKRDEMTQDVQARISNDEAVIS